MTPELRCGLFRWRGGAAADRGRSIPYQLQRLFVGLQGADEPLTTEDLTRSFGWGDGDQFLQQDVTELKNLLLDSLESSFKGTPQDGLIKVRARVLSFSGPVFLALP